MKQDQLLRDQLTKLLRGGRAFKPQEEILSGITAGEAGKKVAGLPYTLWKLIEHLRIALFDILEFSRDPTYQSPPWPDGYWPQEDGPTNQAALDKSINSVAEGLEEMIRLVQDPANDLYKPFIHGEGQNLLREAMLVAEHNAYHLGEMVVIRRQLGHWD